MEPATPTTPQACVTPRRNTLTLFPSPRAYNTVVAFLLLLLEGCMEVSFLPGSLCLKWPH